MRRLTAGANYYLTGAESDPRSWIHFAISFTRKILLELAAKETTRVLDWMGEIKRNKFPKFLFSHETEKRAYFVRSITNARFKIYRRAINSWRTHSPPHFSLNWSSYYFERVIKRRRIKRTPFFFILYPIATSNDSSFLLILSSVNSNKKASPLYRNYDPSLSAFNRLFELQPFLLAIFRYLIEIKKRIVLQIFIIIIILTHL